MLLHFCHTKFSFFCQPFVGHLLHQPAICQGYSMVGLHHRSFTLSHPWPDSRHGNHRLTTHDGLGGKRCRRGAGVGRVGEGRAVKRVERPVHDPDQVRTQHPDCLEDGASSARISPGQPLAVAGQLAAIGVDQPSPCKVGRFDALHQLARELPEEIEVCRVPALSQLLGPARCG